MTSRDASSSTSYSNVMAESMLSTMVGGIVTGVFITPADEESYQPEGYGFTIKSADGITRNIFVLVDEEGNGPGHLDIQEIINDTSAIPDDKEQTSIASWHCNCSKNYAHALSTEWCSNCGLTAPDPDEGKDICNDI
ncbi:MAG: hypothetical protein L3J75_15955 [Methylococcaceae bacterium]|nr:hypothetical protein [Methylococcaceae bacterium]